MCDYRPFPASQFLFLAVALLVERQLRAVPRSIVLIALVLFFALASPTMTVA